MFDHPNPWDLFTNIDLIVIGDALMQYIDIDNEISNGSSPYAKKAVDLLESLEEFNKHRNFAP